MSAPSPEPASPGFGETAAAFIRSVLDWHVEAYHLGQFVLAALLELRTTEGQQLELDLRSQRFLINLYEKGKTYLEVKKIVHLAVQATVIAGVVAGVIISVQVVQTLKMPGPIPRDLSMGSNSSAYSLAAGSSETAITIRSEGTVLQAVIRHVVSLPTTIGRGAWCIVQSGAASFMGLFYHIYALFQPQAVVTSNENEVAELRQIGADALQRSHRLAELRLEVASLQNSYRQRLLLAPYMCRFCVGHRRARRDVVWNCALRHASACAVCAATYIGEGNCTCPVCNDTLPQDQPFESLETAPIVPFIIEVGIPEADLIYRDALVRGLPAPLSHA